MPTQGLIRASTPRRKVTGYPQQGLTWNVDGWPESGPAPWTSGWVQACAGGQGRGLEFNLGSQLPKPPCGIVIVDLQPSLQSLAPTQDLPLFPLHIGSRDLISVMQMPARGSDPGMAEPWEGRWRLAPSPLSKASSPGTACIPGQHPPPPRHGLGPPAASAEVCLSPCAHPSPGDSAVALFPPSGKVTRWRGGPEKWPWGLPVPRASPAYWEDISGWLDERGLLGTGGDWTEDRTRWEGIQAIY